MADSAIVGHLGTAQLAGLGVASAPAHHRAVSVFVFLAYATTAAVSRRSGGRSSSSARQGVDGIWLALLLGAPSSWSVSAPRPPRSWNSSAPPRPRPLMPPPICGSPRPRHPRHARGARLDRCTEGTAGHPNPLYVAVAGFVANAVLNVVLVYGADLGIAGSAWGTVIAQCGMAAGLSVGGRPRSPTTPAPRPARRTLGAGSGLPPRPGCRCWCDTLSLRAILMIATRRGGPAPRRRRCRGASDQSHCPCGACSPSLSTPSPSPDRPSSGAIWARATPRGHARLPQDGGVGRRRGVRAGPARGAVPVRRSCPVHRRLHARRTLRCPLPVIVAVAQPICGVVYVLDGVLDGCGRRARTWPGPCC